VREKHATTRAFLERARSVKGALAGTGVSLIVNDRADVALAVDADGLHVGQDDLPPDVARRLVGPDRVLGVTARTAAEARAAERAGADYVGCSAVFATPTKTDTGPPQGIAGLCELVRAVAIPVVAIGGIDASNVGAVIDAGAGGVAVVSAILAAADPAAAARALRERIDAERRR
jgi:thiamine-phosphate pyrophosphorylase